MKLDSLNLGALVRELSGLLDQAAPQKISQLTEEDYLLALRRPGQTLRLLICLRAEESRLHLVEQPTPGARIPSGFTMLLRKHLEGRRIGSIGQPGLERRVEIHFPAHQEKPELWLVLDIGARDTNLTLQDANRRVLGGHRKVGPAPDPPSRPRADSLSSAELATLLEPGQKLEQAVFGLSPFYARRLSLQNWDGFWDDYRSGRFRPAVTAEGQLNFLGEGEPFATMQQAAEAAWSLSSQAPGLEQLRANALRKVQKGLTRVERRLGELSRDLAETEKAEQYQHWGQLLLARLDQVPPRAAKVSLLEFDESSRVEVPLDARLSGSENAQKLFRRYRKLVRARPLIAAQVEKASAERDYYAEMRLAVEGAVTAEELAELEPRPVPRKPRAERPMVGLRRYQVDGFELWVGRNPAQNDRLTHKLASREDLWFHARNIPGAHVVVRTAGRPPSQEAVLAAAVLAARHSKAGDSSKVEVDFTLVKFVKKPAASPPGKAIYKHETSLVVDPCQPLPNLLELETPKKTSAKREPI